MFWAVALICLIASYSQSLVLAMIKSKHLLAVFASLAMLMGGCGGGGGDDLSPAASETSSSGGSVSIAGTTTRLGSLSSTNSGYVAGSAGKVANARPKAGSVTQSSNVDGSGITVDSVQVAVNYGSTRREFSIRNGSSWSISTADGSPKAAADSDFGQELHKRINNNSSLYVLVFSDIESASDTDYLAAGIWGFVPDSARNANDVTFGAFADGSDPFNQGNLTALTGAASYFGGARGMGIHSNADDAQVGEFTGEVRLQADFGNASALGTIGGSITDLESGDEDIGGSLTLGSANIGSSNSGFFDGRLSGRVGEIDFIGRWGGQFFGNGQTDNKPGAVAGTFGGTGSSGSDKVSFVGIFAAHKR